MSFPEDSWFPAVQLVVLASEISTTLTHLIDLNDFHNFVSLYTEYL